MTNHKNNNKRYTTQEFYDKLLDQEKEAAKRERRMMVKAEERELRIMGEIGSMATAVNQIALQPAVCRAYMEGMNKNIEENQRDIKEVDKKLDEKADKINDRINGLRIWEGFNTVLASVLGYFGIRLGG